MPNHVMYIVRFSGDGDAIRRMREAIQNPEYGIGSIDFNRIIPMPPSLDMEESSCTRAGLRAYQDFIEVYTLGGTINADRLSDIPAASEEAFLKMRKDVNREMFALGKQAWNICGSTAKPHGTAGVPTTGGPNGMLTALTRHSRLQPRTMSLPSRLHGMRRIR